MLTFSKQINIKSKKKRSIFFLNYSVIDIGPLEILFHFKQNTILFERFEIAVIHSFIIWLTTHQNGQILKTFKSIVGNAYNYQTTGAILK